MQPLPWNNKGHFVGKFWMSSRSSLSQFKSNCKFLQWLNGQLNSQQKIFLRACKHGSHHIGLLLHALPRSDIKVFVKQHLCSQLHSDLPDFHLEVKKLYRKHRQIRAYAIVLHTDNGANELADALAKAFPPSTRMCFLSNSIWNAISSKEKSNYLLSHSTYCQDMRALLFRGTNSSSVTIPDSQVSVRECIKNTRSLTGGKLFTEVSDAINGSMVLVMDASKYSEAYQWLSKGLVQIAIHIEHSKFPTTFTRPNWVERHVVRSVGTAPLQAIPQHDELQDNLLLSPLSLSPSSLRSGNPGRVSPPPCKKCSLSDCEHDDATHHISNTRGACQFDANSRSCFEIKPSVASMSDAAMATITSLEHQVKAMHDAMAQLTSTIQALVDHIPNQPFPLASSNLQVSSSSVVPPGPSIPAMHISDTRSSATLPLPIFEPADTTPARKLRIPQYSDACLARVMHIHPASPESLGSPPPSNARPLSPSDSPSLSDSTKPARSYIARLRARQFAARKQALQDISSSPG